MENGISVISGVNCYEENGIAYLKLDDVAKGLGFTKVATSGNEVVRWDRVRYYLKGFGVPTCGHDTFIPENIFYRLAMKAKNKVAENFQALVADEIIPSIRRTGGYVNNDELFINTYLPNADEKTKLMLKAQLSTIKNLNSTIAIQQQQIAELEPKATYYDAVLQSTNAMTVREIAKDYGWEAQKLNNFLHEQKVQYKCGGTWLLYSKYARLGYTKTVTVPISKNGHTFASVYSKWTQKGRLFIYELMKNAGNLPLIEQDDEEVTQ